jgi:hypothetical protein
MLLWDKLSLTSGAARQKLRPIARYQYAGDHTPLAHTNTCPRSKDQWVQRALFDELLYCKGKYAYIYNFQWKDGAKAC